MISRLCYDTTCFAAVNMEWISSSGNERRWEGRGECPNITFPFLRAWHCHVAGRAAVGSCSDPGLTTTRAKCRINIDANILRQPYPRFVPAVMESRPREGLRGWWWRSAGGPLAHGGQGGRFDRLPTIKTPSISYHDPTAGFPSQGALRARNGGSKTHLSPAADLLIY